MTSPFAYYFLHDATGIMALRVADRQSVVFDPGNGMDTRHIYRIETQSPCKVRAWALPRC